MEMIVLLNKFKKDSDIKIKNISKMNRQVLIENCIKYKLLNSDNYDSKITVDFNLLTKKQLHEDIQTFYVRKGVYIDKIEKLNKETLIELMISENIPHITKDDIKKETIQLERYNASIDIIKYNIMKYNNISQNDIKNIYKIYSIDEIEEYIKHNNLDTNIKNLENITELVTNIYNSLKIYCEKSNTQIDVNKTLPSLLNRLSMLDST